MPFDWSGYICQPKQWDCSTSKMWEPNLLDESSVFRSGCLAGFYSFHTGCEVRCKPSVYLTALVENHPDLSNIDRFLLLRRLFSVKYDKLIYFSEIIFPDQIFQVISISWHFICDDSSDISKIDVELDFATSSIQLKTVAWCNRKQPCCALFCVCPVIVG